MSLALLEDRSSHLYVPEQRTGSSEDKSGLQKKEAVTG